MREEEGGGKGRRAKNGEIRGKWLVFVLKEGAMLLFLDVG